MVDLKYLRLKASIHGYDTVNSICELLGISKNTFYKRVNESSKVATFSLEDVRVMAQAFHLTMQDTWNIFICGDEEQASKYNLKRSTNKRSNRQ